MGLLSSRLSAKEMAPMCRQLATTYDAGIPIVKGLQLSAGNAGSRRTKQTLEAMADAIIDGASLSQAAKAQRAALPDFFVEVVTAGEVGGRLDVLLRDLADYYEGAHAMWRSVVAAMVYPIMQLTAAWFLGTFALGLVKNINPMSTDRFSLGDYLSGYAQFQVAAIFTFALVVGTVIVLVRLGALRAPGSLIKNYVWPIRPIAQKFALARFFRSMSLLIGAGLDMRLCIARSAAVTMNPMIEKDLLRAIPVVAGGGTLVDAFAACRRISRVGREMIAVGEQSGNLENSLKKVAEYHFAEAEAATRNATTIMKVLIILAIGVIVGTIVIRFYGNLYGSMLDGL